jgi:hypothetical protein
VSVSRVARIWRREGLKGASDVLRHIFERVV